VFVKTCTTYRKYKNALVIKYTIIYNLTIIMRAAWRI